MIVQDDIDKAYELWYHMNPDNVISLTTEELDGFTGNSLNVVISRLRKIILERGLDVSPLVKLVKSVIDEEKIRKSPIDFGIVTVDLTERKAVEIFKEEIPEGRIADYIIASASFPAFKPTVIDGRMYIDGAFYNNLPVNLVRKKGCSNIIVVRTYGFGIKRHMDLGDINLINIAPSENLGPILDFNTDRARKNLEMGYFDGLKVFRKLKGKKYYIEPMNDDSFFITYLAGISNEKLEKLCGLFGIESCSGRRLLFEYLVPKVADLLGLPPNVTYEDIAVGLLEKIAEECGVERFRIYNIREFYSEITERYKYQEDDFIKEIPGFLRGKDLLARFVRERIIGIIANVLFDTTAI
jgi:NTE family protein